MIVQAFLVRSWLPGSALRTTLLRWFGAKVGQGVVIKPGLRVKFPWRLEIGDHCWLGEDLWIDNLAPVVIESHCCLSQGAYLCTGSHDWSKSSFDLVVRPIRLREGAWVGAFAKLAPGTVVGTGAIVALGSVAKGELAAFMVHQGNPAVVVRERVIQGSSGDSIQVSQREER